MLMAAAVVNQQYLTNFDPNEMTHQPITKQFLTADYVHKTSFLPHFMPIYEWEEERNV